MVGFLIFYSEIIPTACFIVALYFLISGILDNEKTYTYVGVALSLLSVLLPFVILNLII